MAFICVLWWQLSVVSCWDQASPFQEGGNYSSMWRLFMRLDPSQLGPSPAMWPMASQEAYPVILGGWRLMICAHPASQPLHPLHLPKVGLLVYTFYWLLCPCNGSDVCSSRVGFPHLSSVQSGFRYVVVWRFLKYSTGTAVYFFQAWKLKVCFFKVK